MVWMLWRLSACSSAPHISMLPPRPMMSSSGRPLPRMETRMRWRSTRTKVSTRVTVSRCGSQVDVAAWRRPEGRVALTAEVEGRLLLVARAFRKPRQPVVPPAALVRGCVVFPGQRVGRRRARPGQVHRLLVAGRVDDGLDVAAGAEHELATPAEQLGGLVRAVPRDAVVGRARHHVRVADDEAEIDRCAEHLEPARA